MSSLANVYQIIDDSGSSAGPAGGLPGGGSGAPLSSTFTAPSLAAAQAVANLFASVFQRPVRLVAFGGSPPWSLYIGQPANVALTPVVPSGIGY